MNTTDPLLGLTRTRLADLLTVLVRPGEDLYAALSEGLRRAGVERATVVAGIGALGRTTARNLRGLPNAFPVTDDDRLFVTVPGPCELVSLTGWAAPYASGRQHLHLHFAASYAEGEEVRLIGGHLSPGACEASIHLAVTFAVHADVEARYLFDESIGVERLSLPADGPVEGEGTGGGRVDDG